MNNESSIRREVYRPAEGAFSRAVLVEGGRLYFISGEGPNGEDGEVVGKGDESRDPATVSFY